MNNVWNHNFEKLLREIMKNLMTDLNKKKLNYILYV